MDTADTGPRPWSPSVRALPTYDAEAIYEYDKRSTYGPPSERWETESRRAPGAAYSDIATHGEHSEAYRGSALVANSLRASTKSCYKSYVVNKDVAH